MNVKHTKLWYRKSPALKVSTQLPWFLPGQTLGVGIHPAELFTPCRMDTLMSSPGWIITGQETGAMESQKGQNLASSHTVSAKGPQTPCPPGSIQCGHLRPTMKTV